jgi:hypothetical protein
VHRAEPMPPRPSKPAPLADIPSPAPARKKAAKPKTVNKTRKKSSKRDDTAP